RGADRGARAPRLSGRKEGSRGTMISLRRRYRRARRGVRLQRFHVAMLLTIVVLAYAGVPHVARVVDGMSGYTSGHYEPKDTEREAWVQRGDDPDAFLSRIPWGTIVHV